ncbi:MAG: M23 family metallopeptidase [Treponema sp.]|nr:M23 family metallopeptidase [Treponema sp.]
MAVIIEKQHISKRRKTASSRFNNRSNGLNNGFINQFRQKPVLIRRSKTNGLTSWIKNLIHNSSREKPLSYKKRLIKRYRDVLPKSKGSGFSFPAPSLATLAIAAGIVIIALAAFNFEEIDFRMPNLNNIQLAGNNETEQSLFQYAMYGIPGIFGEINGNPQLPALENGVFEEINSQNAENDNPHGMLQTFEWQQYKVQRGDSVSAIAQKFKVSVGAIIASNEIRNARRLQEGVVLRIPNIDGIPYQIKNGDNLSKISASFNIPLEVILDVNDIKNDNIKPGETIFIPGARMNDIDLRLSLGELFMFPLQGRFITSGYGMRKDPISGVLQFHAGVDFRANIGTTVMASLDGTVSVVGENWLYGKYIIISHSNGYKTLYGHLNSFSVRQGDRVARGRKIGEVGNTGYSTGPHLHFGIYDKNNRLVNPLDLLN